MSVFKYSICLAILFISVRVCNAQDQTNKIVKITYTSIPVSQYNITKSDLLSSPTRGSILDVLKGTKSYYSLYVNLVDRSSVYVLDSVTSPKVPGREQTKASIAEKVNFTLKSLENKTYKYEWVMHQIFFTEGKSGDITWELTNETKKINGLDCFKAVAKDKNLMLTAWYTKSIPVSNGPSIYQGLPGLVVSVEDFFRTTEIKSIEYSNNVKQYAALYEEKMEFFNEKEHKNNYDKEAVLTVKKADMALSLYRLIHGKAYTY